MKYIVVFDTNILISALFSQTGSPFRALALAKIGQIESVTCQEIMDEFAEKLLLKFKFSEDKTQSAVGEILSFSRMVEISGTLKAVPNDADDDMVIECAVIGNASHIVTGDKHLLSLVKYQDIAIAKATDFVNLFS
ncbi:MAG: putative toxin-antitoxin system toxin component, PIN family [Pseudanabaena sp.]|uniref:putative toxin-antitoxin system toxin component, PIN family n=1 Tax=Microcystis sp. M158S2 TaxID=2771152 RepID=UPI0025851925|nr:putative toxin-antitoxin system toxin component, PIN family [Microcystis sp. M158S2]MCA6502314.1 putative toxin-antitoxin system toxin component, PIN family [Pseudanabaena sp. M090S1SP2A07QC]MCA6508033.1 putative toxin-antitoxin system toxin component, PIN family [Pseudanabaena sp. M172S2SP2A07QC]MCA6520192.1 putative toxin-antitoxin system toxin component, PIN family [Pseudanabaena sp. M110S1SP2A07QC]MCA6523383.1 putative toxin-antitoxin system toxin component, PIN family [Pseudanabaena sp.